MSSFINEVSLSALSVAISSQLRALPVSWANNRLFTDATNASLLLLIQSFCPSLLSIMMMMMMMMMMMIMTVRVRSFINS